MRRVAAGLGFGGFAAVAAVAGYLVACNGLLGIGPASVEPADEHSDASVPFDAGPPALTCGYYCAAIMNNCTGSNAEYLSYDICMSMCPAFDPGMSIADTANDTLGCRVFNTEAAATNPNQMCRYAGPLGGGHCGKSPCPAFCALDVTYCTVAFPPVPYPNGDPECETECGQYDYLVQDAGDTTTESGDTLNCRLWHLETAYTSPQFGAFHCQHTEKMSNMCFAPDSGASADSGARDQ